MSVQYSERRRTAPRRVAFYDLDDTLAELNLVDAALFIFANLGQWSRRAAYLLRLVARLPTLYRAERTDRALFNRAIFELFRGTSRDRLELIGEEYCERVIERRFYPGALEILERNRRRGLEPVLVTGSPDFIVAPVARRLGIADFAANRLAYAGNIATGRLIGPVMAGYEKAAWCRAYAARNRIDLKLCWAYADSHYDLPFLEAVGTRVAVNPDASLERIARSRHWPILRLVKGSTHNPAPGRLDVEEFDRKTDSHTGDENGRGAAASERTQANRVGS